MIASILTGVPSRILKDNRPVFVTFGTFKRWDFPTEARQLVLDCCLRERGATIDLHALVVMPTHVHLLFTALRNAEGWLVSLPQVMRLIKGRSAHFLNQLLTGAVRFGKKSLSTMFCAQMRA